MWVRSARALCVTRALPHVWVLRARPDARLALPLGSELWKTLDVLFPGLVVRTVRLWVLFFCVCFGTFCFELKMSVTPWPRMSPSQSARRPPAAAGARPGLNKLFFSWLFTDVRPSAASRRREVRRLRCTRGAPHRLTPSCVSAGCVVLAQQNRISAVRTPGQAGACPGFGGGSRSFRRPGACWPVCARPRTATATAWTQMEDPLRGPATAPRSTASALAHIRIP